MSSGICYSSSQEIFRSILMKIGILQPGRLGDIIICLPIAKYYADQGFEVVWPMFESAAMMVRDVVDYPLTIIPRHGKCLSNGRRGPSRVIEGKGQSYLGSCRNLSR